MTNKPLFTMVILVVLVITATSLTAITYLPAQAQIPGIVTNINNNSTNNSTGTGSNTTIINNTKPSVHTTNKTTTTISAPSSASVPAKANMTIQRPANSNNNTRPLTAIIFLTKHQMQRGTANTISVEVLDSITNTPVQNANVTITIAFGPSAQIVKTFIGTTDEQGLVSFSFLIASNSNPGQFVVGGDVSAVGYVAARPSSESFDVLPSVIAQSPSPATSPILSPSSVAKTTNAVENNNNNTAPAKGNDDNAKECPPTLFCK